MAPTQGTLGIGRQFPGPGNRACKPEPSNRAGLNEKTRPGPGLAVATGAIGPPVQRAQDRLLFLPARHLRVVAGEQNFGHLPPVPALGPRILRVLQQPGAEGLVIRRPFAGPQNARHQPDDGINHHRRRESAVRQDVVADRNLVANRLADIFGLSPLGWWEFGDGAEVGGDVQAVSVPVLGWAIA